MRWLGMSRLHKRLATYRAGMGAGLGNSPVRDIWIASHLWGHYRFTGDEQFLKQRAYPVLNEAAEFFLDSLVMHLKYGYLVSGQSASPKNAFFAPDGFKCAESVGTVRDTVMVADLFTSCIKASEILSVNADFRKKLDTARAKVPSLMIGKHGQLQEWLEDFEEAVPNHRHTSHLVALFPGSTISSQDRRPIRPSIPSMASTSIPCVYWKTCHQPEGPTSRTSSRTTETDATFPGASVTLSIEPSPVLSHSAGPRFGLWSSHLPTSLSQGL